MYILAYRSDTDESSCRVQVREAGLRSLASWRVPAIVHCVNLLMKSPHDPQDETSLPSNAGRWSQ